MQKVVIKKSSGNFGVYKELDVWILENFFERLKGLMLKKNYFKNQAALLINKNENKIESTIHMLFMNFDISVFWLDTFNKIVDKKIAKKWGLIYYPKSKSQKILEAHTEIFDKLQIGDQLIIEYS